MKKAIRKLALKSESIRNIGSQLGNVHGGVSDWIACPPSGNCGSVAATACTNSKDICPSDNCGPSVHNSPEC
jgi:hypothetical protein